MVMVMVMVIVVVVVVVVVAMMMMLMMRRNGYASFRSTSVLSLCHSLSPFLSLMFLSILFDLLLRPGWKYNYHELRGVPIRIEIGLKDIETDSVTAVRRVDGSRASIVRIISEKYFLFFAREAVELELKFFFGAANDDTFLRIDTVRQ